MNNITKRALHVECAPGRGFVFYIVDDLSDDVIGQADDSGSHDGKTNATLWAASADLLAACEKAEKRFPAYPGYIDPLGVELRAAIAKARGRNQT